MNVKIEKTKIFLAGDSTVANNPNSTYPQAGWGQMIGELLGESIEVHNYALNGRSTKSFIDEGWLMKIKNEISRGDYLFIQFGHNDEKKEDPTRYTEPFTSFKNNLKEYIGVAKNKEATPILITPVNRRNFDEHGKIINTHKNYYEAMIEVAKETQTYVIDLCKKSQILFENYGYEKSKELFMIFESGKYANYPDGSRDNTHFNYFGAKKIAALVAEDLTKLNL